MAVMNLVAICATIVGQAVFASRSKVEPFPCPNAGVRIAAYYTPGFYAEDTTLSDNAGNWAECADACKQSPECQWWNFEWAWTGKKSCHMIMPKGSHWTKKDISKYTRYEKNAVSGTRGCQTAGNNKNYCFSNAPGYQQTMECCNAVWVLHNVSSIFLICFI